MFKALRRAIPAIATTILLAPAVLQAQESATPVAVSVTTAEAAPTRSVGPVTGLPMPRYVSLKTSRGRARRGPSDTHRVDWIFTHRDLPLRVTGEFEHWRRVEDAEGEGGWVHYSLLSGVRTVLVTQDMVAMRSNPMPDASEVARLETGVVARIMHCDPIWCQLSVEGVRGWVDRTALWGLDPGETLD
ncbi:hypothetical protein LCM17_23285 [Cereibacter sphaeroides]|nr:hypothetical protein [Cereibacter sphaeroides]